MTQGRPGRPSLTAGQARLRRRRRLHAPRSSSTKPWPPATSWFHRQPGGRGTRRGHRRGGRPNPVTQKTTAAPLHPTSSFSRKPTRLRAQGRSGPYHDSPHMHPQPSTRTPCPPRKPVRARGISLEPAWGTATPSLVHSISSLDDGTSATYSRQRPAYTEFQFTVECSEAAWPSAALQRLAATPQSPPRSAHGSPGGKPLAEGRHPTLRPPIMAALTRQGRDPCQSEPSTSAPGTEPAPTSAS